ncbi:MAG: AEC family transporter [Lachnospiraceae bacterium]|nr:AEC family transporter [Lachnospiraceae bacterium]
MEASVIFRQMCMIFLLIAVGYAACKRGIVNHQAGKAVSAIVVNICNPALMLTSVLESGGGISNGKLLLAAVAGISIYACLLIIGKALPIFLGKDSLERDQYTLMTLFGNIGFIGIPVISAVLGAEVLIYVIICNIIFNILVYTYGRYLVCRHSGQGAAPSRGVINTGTVVGVACVALFLLKPDLPEVLVKSVDYVGSATTFLSMMVIGISLANMPLGKIFREARLYVYILVRHILIPIAIGWALKFLINDPEMVGTLVLLVGMPVANLPLMMCEENGVDGTLLSKGIVLSTLFSLVTIPLVVYGVALS